jgi:orotate phosphoribosyltransferase
MQKALTIAAYLLDIQSVKLSVDNPFTWSSGWKSPIYCDNRLILSYPTIRTFVKEEFVALIREKFPQAAAIAGVATAGIAHGALIADALEQGYIYVRTSPKSHGLKNMIEGRIEPNKEYVIVEDLISTGGSSLKVVEALQDAGAKIAGVVAIFSYGFPEATQAFAEKNIPFYTLSHLEALLTVAHQRNYLDSVATKSIQDWQRSPASWGGDSPS